MSDQQLEDDMRKILHMNVSTKKDEKSAKSSSSDSDEDVERVTAILSYEFSDDFKCVAGNHCRYEDPKSHPKGIRPYRSKLRTTLLFIPLFF